MIQVRGLTKSYGGRKVLRGVDLDVDRGQCLMLMGPNGAGKTTLLRVLAGLAKPGDGVARVAGLDLGKDSNSARRSVGFVSHQPLLYEDLNALDNLRFYGRLYGVESLEARMAALLAQVGLWARRNDPVRVFSRGMRQRLSIARALLHDPPVLLLDEPYTGLDQAAAQVLDSLLILAGESAAAAEAGAPCTVLLTTHDLEHALAIGAQLGRRRMAILAQGRLVYQMAQDTPADVADFRAEYARWMAPTLDAPRRARRAG